MSEQVLIVGAGPTGLVLALWLSQFGIRPRIIDRVAEPGTTSRALAVQARTLELYRQIGLADDVLRAGHSVKAVNLWVRGQRAAQLPFGAVGEGLTAYPFLHIFPQDEHERLLIARLAAAGITVERSVELISARNAGDGVEFALRHAGGRQEQGQSAFVVGCDGAHSAVRGAMGVSFSGGTYRQLFYVADIEGAGLALDGQLHIDLDEADFLAIFPLSGTGRVRLIGTVRDERADDAGALGFDDVSQRAMTGLGLVVNRVNWFSTYHVHHRVADAFRADRMFIAGDAAHIHSPAGGQGMNTGIGDAINLAWKLAAVLNGKAPMAILDSYQAERIGFARRLVETTDRVFSFVTAEGRLADRIRMQLVPRLFPRLIRLAAVRDFMFRTVSQIMISYRGGPLAEGRAGAVHGGDRLPWVRVDGSDNFAPLIGMHWQVHVYGEPTPDLEEWCAEARLPLHAFAWQDIWERKGLARDAGYLIRPDGYVAAADPDGAPDRIAAFLESRGLRGAGSADPSENQPLAPV